MGKLVRNGIEYSGSGGGGGGSSVEITPSLVSGTKIADYEIDGTEGSLYAPTPQVIEANPAETASSTLTKLGIDGDIYELAGGGSGDVEDVYVNGTSVLDSNKIAQITSYKEITQAQYDALPATKESDGVLYCIKDAASTGGGNSAIILNGQIYSTEERQIGIWLDGKPLYQKTWDFGSQIAIPSNTWTDTNIRLADWNIENIVLTFSTDNSRSATVFIGASASEGNTYLQLLNARDSALGVRYLTVQYTKTTDTSGGGGYQAYGFSPIIYSTTEREIGVWVDNKPLYQKTIDTGLIPSNTTKTIAHNISNIETIVSYFGIALNSSGSDAREMPYVGFSDWNISLYVDATNINIQTKQNWENDFPRSYVTIQYTKTTDTPGSGSYNTLGVPTHHYSTDEQVVGTWIDGSTLYEITLDITLTGTNHTEDLSSLGINKFCKYSGVIIKTSGTPGAYTLCFPYVEGSNWYQVLTWDSANNNLIISSSNDMYANYKEVILTIQYTK